MIQDVIYLKSDSKYASQQQASWEEKLCYNRRLWRRLSVECVCGTRLFVTKFGFDIW